MNHGGSVPGKPGSCAHPVGVGGLAVSKDPWEVLVTYSLGSCVGLTLYDPVAQVGGLLHSQLPLSRSDPAQAASWPSRFTDTGVMLLLEQVYALGAHQNRLIAKAAGGSSLLDEEGRFRIGEKNIAVMRKVLWKNNIVLAAEDLGGKVSRTMYLHMDSGDTMLRVGGQLKELV